MITGKEPINAVHPYKELEEDIKRGYPFGLSIRQHFAAMAMQGLMACNEKGCDDWKEAIEKAAKISVQMADALIAELNKP